MNHNEFENIVRSMTEKATHSFTILTFTTLALSYQFSPQMGNNSLWILMLSWSFLFLASLAGGWIIVKSPVYYRNNLFAVKIAETIDLLNKKAQVQASNEAITQAINDEKNKLEKANSLMKKLEPNFPRAAFFQTIFFILGVVCKGFRQVCPSRSTPKFLRKF